MKRTNNNHCIFLYFITGDSLTGWLWTLISKLTTHFRSLWWAEWLFLYVVCIFVEPAWNEEKLHTNKRSRTEYIRWLRRHRVFQIKALNQVCFDDDDDEVIILTHQPANTYLSHCHHYQHRHHVRSKEILTQFTLLDKIISCFIGFLQLYYYQPRRLLHTPTSSEILGYGSIQSQLIYKYRFIIQ